MIYTIGSMVGSLFTGPICDQFGRRAGMATGSLLIMVGAAVQTSARNDRYLLGGRFVLGFGVAIGTSAAPTYALELAPPQWRARIVGYYNTCGLIPSCLPLPPRSRGSDRPADFPAASLLHRLHNRHGRRVRLQQGRGPAGLPHPYGPSARPARVHHRRVPPDPRVPPLADHVGQTGSSSRDTRKVPRRRRPGAPGGEARASRVRAGHRYAAVLRRVQHVQLLAPREHAQRALAVPHDGLHVLVRAAVGQLGADILPAVHVHPPRRDLDGAPAPPDFHELDRLVRRGRGRVGDQRRHREADEALGGQRRPRGAVCRRDRVLEPLRRQ